MAGIKVNSSSEAHYPEKRFNTVSGEHFDIQRQKKETNEKIINLPDPYAVTYSGKGRDNGLIQVIATDPTKNPLQGAQRPDEILEKSSNAVVIYLTIENGVPMFRTAYRGDDGNVQVNPTAEGPTTKKDILEQLSKENLVTEEVNDKQGKAFVRVKIKVEGETKFVVVRGEQYTLLREYLRNRKKAQQQPAEGDTHVIFEKEKESAPADKTENPEIKKAVPDSVIDITPHINKKHEQKAAIKVDTVSNESKITQSAPEKAIEAISEGVFTPVLKELDNITAEDLTLEGRTKFLKKFKTQRMLVIAAFALDSWKLVVNNKDKEKLVFKKISEKFIEKMRGLFPSVKAKALEATIISQWKRFQASVSNIAQKYPVIPDPKVVPFVPKIQEASHRVSENIKIINGVVVRTPQQDENKIVEMADVKERKEAKRAEKIIDFQKKVHEGTVKKTAQTVENSKSEKPAAPASIWAKAKGFLGKVFKRAA
ncbi:MAG: hypothetical protein ACK4NC_05045 [Candidatus Gracilibacteria bacterium]